MAADLPGSPWSTKTSSKPPSILRPTNFKVPAEIRTQIQIKEKRDHAQASEQQKSVEGAENQNPKVQRQGEIKALRFPKDRQGRGHQKVQAGIPQDIRGQMRYYNKTTISIIIIFLFFI